MKKAIFVLLAVLMITDVSFAVLYDDFQDGDTTNNPTWNLIVDVGEGIVASDPVRSGNLAWKANGTVSAHRWLTTDLGSGISWDNFDMSLEFMATQGYFSIRQDITNGNYQIGVGVWLDNRMPGYTNNVVLAIEEYGGYNSDNWVLIPTSNFSYNQWYEVHSWYDGEAGLVRTELLLETGQLVAQTSRIPTMDYSIEPLINSTGFGIEELNWQYIDNVVLTPEPTTLSLFAIGAVVLLRRRRVREA